MNYLPICNTITTILALFYYTLGNIQPNYRASLRMIQLIAVVTYPLLKEYGFDSVLKPFVNDMNKLAEVCAMHIKIIIVTHNVGM